jgi:uncharacterized protein YjeT (DUF2065 family)
MVNVLEGLYFLTVLAFIAAIIQFVRNRRDAALRFVWLGALAAGASLLLYWFLRSSA